MKVLCLVDKYFPDSSANTICADNIANFFKAKGHQFDFLAIKNSADDLDYAVYNGSNIIKIGTYYDDVLKKYGKKYNAKSWMELPWFFRKIRSFFQRLKSITRISTGYSSLDVLDYNGLYKKITKINKHYDCLITFCMPFAFQVVGKELMKRGIADRWYPIFLDAFVYNKCLAISKINYRKKVAKKVLKKANHIFMVDGIVGENKKQCFNPEYHKKVTEIYIPMLKEVSLPKIEKTTKKTNLVYAGLFYRDIRNPEKMLNILSRLSSECEIKLFGQGCEDIVDEKKKLFDKSTINLGGLISHEECLNEISKADFLINLGNSITNQMPSKVFEYISFGKPIINFYFTEEDMCLKVFKSYPLAFNINVNNYTEEDVKNLNKFIYENKGKLLNYKEATKNLEDYKVENIAEKIYRIIEK